MGDPRVPKYRQRRFDEQHHRCYYCGFPMWFRTPNGFVAHFSISLAEAQRFRCTAEHLKALAEGGTARTDNIVAACWFCNSHRHMRAARIDAETFRALVQRRVASRSWHPPWLHKMLGRKHQIA